jgi:hypothetical protein
LLSSAEWFHRLYGTLDRNSKRTGRGGKGSEAYRSDIRGWTHSGRRYSEGKLRAVLVWQEIQEGGLEEGASDHTRLGCSHAWTAACASTARTWISSSQNRACTLWSSSALLPAFHALLSSGPSSELLTLVSCTTGTGQCTQPDDSSIGIAKRKRDVWTTYTEIWWSEGWVRSHIG